MRQFLSCSVLVSMFFLMSCAGSGSGGGDKAVDTDGNCTSDTIALHNSIKQSTDLFISTHNSTHLKTTQESCAKLNEILGAKSCKAADANTHQEMTVSYENVRSVCAQADRVLSAKPDTDRESEPTRPVVSDENSVAPAKTHTSANIPNGFKLKIFKAKELTQFFQSQGDVFLQAGKVIVDKSQVDRGQLYCLAVRSSQADKGQNKVQPNQSLSFSRASIFSLEGGNNVILFQTEDSVFSFSCGGLLVDADDVTLKDVKSLFGSAAQVQ